MRSTLVRTFVAGLAFVTLALGSAGSAAAAGGSATVAVGAASDGNSIGSATFGRSTTGGGSETLTIHFAVPGGIDASHVCLQPQPFSGRVSPGQCPYSQGPTGSSADYTINLGRAYAGQTVYIQASVVSQGQTAFAGWQPGQPFYGNVGLTVEGTVVPVGILGGLGLALVVGLGLALRLRPRPTSSIR